jgi:peptide-methionine (S)-S-oxide reductase
MKKNKFAVAAAVAAVTMTCGVQAKETAVAIFAGGCFWSIESDFDHAPGVVDTTSGYIGGTMPNPTYEQVSTETTGYREAVKVTYDPSVTSYDKLLAAYWHMTDPTSANGQFCDFGDSYRPGLFPLDKAQYDADVASKAEVAKELGKPVATTIEMAPTFYAAEDYHQNFWKTNSAHYLAYRAGCGKNAQVEALWGKTAFLGLDGHE